MTVFSIWKNTPSLMGRFKTEMMYVGIRQRPVEEVVEDAMYETDISVVKSYLIKLLAHAYDTQDDVLRNVCDEISAAHNLEPSLRTPASGYNVPGAHQDSSSPQQQAKERMREFIQSKETFADRVKNIMKKAAQKNGQCIETHAKGHSGAYIYNVNADAFCKAMDGMVNMHGKKLKELLDGSLNCLQVTKVCFFIGNVIRMHVINDVNLQTVDVLFAFEDYYDNLQTVKAKLGDKKITDDQKVILGSFEGLLKKHMA